MDGPGKVAQSVVNSKLGKPWIQLHLRGERAVGAATRLTFRYRLSGTDSLQVHLVNQTLRDHHLVDLKGLPKDEWAEATVDFGTSYRQSNGQSGKPRPGDRVDEIWFVLPDGGRLWLEDLLLYEPAGK
jgi:hypothetical protein